MMNKIVTIVSILFLLFSACEKPVKKNLSETEFKNPSAEFKPRTWFHVMSGNMSREGLTKDLEAIENVGIGGILLFNVSQGIPNGPVKYNSAEHHELLKHAAAECERLGLSFGVHNCDGWSSSGGPWITPEQSMKMVVWSEIVTNGGEVKIQLPQPTKREGFYEDIAVLAYPSLKSETNDVKNQPKITSSDKNFDVSVISDNRLDAETQIKQTGKELPWIQFEFESEKEIRSAFLVFKDRNGEVTLHVSDDGKNFRAVKNLFKVRTGKDEWAINESLNPVKSKYFRFQLSQTMSFKEAKLFSTQSIDNFLARTNMARTEDHELTPIGNPAPEMIINKNQIIDLTSECDEKGNLKTTLPEGTWTIMRFGITSTGAFNHPASDEGRGLECDKFSREAFKFHYEAFSKKVIENTRELAPNAMQYIEIDSYEMGGQNWTKDYNEIFKQEKGYNIVEYLPLFAGRFVESAEVSEKILWDVRDVNCRLMSENYFDYFAELCREDGIKSYIEPYGFGPLNDLDVGAKADINMGEFWMNREMTMVQSAVSASHIYGKNVISAESFTSTPEINWKGNPAMAKKSGDLAWTFGINEFMFHRFAHQANTHVKPGMTMNRWGFHFDRTQTWWENAGADWFKYMARGQYLLRQGVPVSDLLVFVGDGSPNSVFLRNDFKPVIPAGTNFDCVNADVLLNRIQIKNKKLLLSEGTEYRMLLLQNSETMSLPTLKRVHEIALAGIPVVGKKPLKIAGYLTTREEFELFEKLVTEIWEQSTTFSEFNWLDIFEKEQIFPDLSIANQANFNFIHRKTADADIYFLFNPDSLARQLECNFRVQDKIPELWNPLTGETNKSAQFKIGENSSEVWINLKAEESVFVVFRESAKGVPSVSEPEKLAQNEYFLSGDNKLQAEKREQKAIIQISENWEVEFLEENDYKAKHVFENLIDWKDHSEKNINYYSGTAIYRKTFDFGEEVNPSEKRYILELGDVKIVAEVKLNGKDLGVFWMPPYKANISKALRRGKNSLEIKITNQWSNKLIGDERFPTSYPAFKLEGNFPKNKMVEWYVNNEPLPTGQRTTFCTADFYRADDPLMPSGLLGPVFVVSKDLFFDEK